MSYEHDMEFHAARMELINEQREYARIEHEQKMKGARDERRAEFAKAAMQGMFANPNPFIVDKIISDVGADDVQEACVKLADALIAELEKEKP